MLSRSITVNDGSGDYAVLVSAGAQLQFGKPVANPGLPKDIVFPKSFLRLLF